MFLRACSLGVILVGASVPAFLTTKTGEPQSQDSGRVTAPTAQAAEAPTAGEAVPKQPAATEQRKDASPNLSGLIRDLAGQYVSVYFPSNPISWDATPLSVLIGGDRLISLFGNTGSDSLPAELISAQFSRRFLENYFQRAVERDSPVDDEVLGLRIAGRSHVSGKVHLVWHEPDQSPGFDLIFTGVCDSQTDALHEIVTVHNQAQTQFEARKQFFWTDAGLKTLPAVATAETHSKTVSIDSSLPGIVGRIATGIARDRAAERRAQADAISSQHSAQRIARGFDARVDHQLAVLRLASQHLPVGGFLRRATRFELASTAESLHVGLYRRNAESERAEVILPENCDAVIRLHRGVFQLALADRTGLYLIGAALLQYLSAESEEALQPPWKADGAAQTAGHWQLVRSADGDWLVLEHLSPMSPEEVSPGAVPRPALISPVSQQRPITR